MSSRAQAAPADGGAYSSMTTPLRTVVRFNKRQLRSLAPCGILFGKFDRTIHERIAEAFMTTATIERIETDIAQLSLTEQLWLMERLMHRIRQVSLRPVIVQNDDLAAMAADPAIQQELQHIDAEFAVTEMDGLDRAQ